jgi:phytoene dehydrogenase-like protein
MSEKYDVVIIGAGIGGLVCGCYLAKAGLKVLIVEQHNKPGGCCTSFNRKGFRFDAGVHSLGSLRDGGMLNKILIDLNLLNKIEFLRSDPTDRIIFPGKTIFIRKNRIKTKEELINHFPTEKQNINKFFDLILNEDFLYVFSKIKNMTFAQLSNSFFKDRALKNILATLLGNIGLPPSRASGLIASVVFREFVLDGGYYPKGGTQEFSDLLCQRLQEYGGEIIFNTKISKILIKNRKILGAIAQNENVFQANIVVSNIDATTTFKQLITFATPERKMVDKLIPSSSAFILYLGLNKTIDIKPRHFTTLYFNNTDIEKCYGNEKELFKLNRIKYMFCTFSALIDPTLAPLGKSIIRVFIGVEGKQSNMYTNDRKISIRNKIIKEINALFCGNIEKDIEVAEIATPETFINYTGNRNGAIFGWAAIPQQVKQGIFPYYTSIRNLFLAGHWVTNGAGQSGVAVVAFSGKRTAKRIIELAR